MLLKSDKEIINAIQSGNNDLVLSYLYKEVLPMVINHVVKNKGNKEEAKDIFQDAVIILYKKIKKSELDANVNIIGFVFHISKNLWINRVKRMYRIQSIPEYHEVGCNDTILDALIQEERKNAVLKCFAELGDECQKLLKYSVYEKLSMKEISHKLGYSSENVAKTYNYRCKQKLLEIVKKNKNVVTLVRE